MEQVQKTKNYAQFKYLLGNRPIHRYHLRKLRESIQTIIISICILSSLIKTLKSSMANIGLKSPAISDLMSTS